MTMSSIHLGASGCGKSTTVQLLERFYDVAEGQLVSFSSFCPIRRIGESVPLSVDI
jgi:ABC-type multidrug transport system fused ATPase/permease subunit